MTERQPPHPEEHELRILRAALDDDPPDPAVVAQQVASCPACLAFAFRTMDDLFSLHTISGSRRATATPTELRSVSRLDHLLDDAMVLMAYREPSPPPDKGAGEKAQAGGKRSIPIGDS